MNQRMMACLASLLVIFFAHVALFAESLDKKALAWFPKEVHESAPQIAKRIDFAPGVEYGYVFCNKLFGNPGDIHAIKIDLTKAKVKPMLYEGSTMQNKKLRLRTTASAAASQKALFAINGGFFKWEDLIPYYRLKYRGEVLPSTAGGTHGLAFSNDGKKVFVGNVSDTELHAWDNFIAGETIVRGGKCCLDWKRPETPKTKPDAPRTFFGMDKEQKTLWLFVTDGRKTGKKASMGLTYLEAADILLWFGCEEGSNIDGGGSSTLAVREDVLRKAKKPYTPEAHPSKTSGYVILNSPSDGNERAVLDHILFCE